MRSIEAEGMDWMVPVQKIITRLHNLAKQQSMEMLTLHFVSAYGPCFAIVLTSVANFFLEMLL